MTSLCFRRRRRWGAILCVLLLHRHQYEQPCSFVLRWTLSLAYGMTPLPAPCLRLSLQVGRIAVCSEREKCPTGNMVAGYGGLHPLLPHLLLCSILYIFSLSIRFASGGVNVFVETTGSKLEPNRPEEPRRHLHERFGRIQIAQACVMTSCMKGIGGRSCMGLACKISGINAVVFS